MPLELGRCLLVLGTAQRRARQRRAAAATLDEAIDVLTRLGAMRWADLAHTQRTRLTHAAADTLTPTEQRITDLVAQGRTNAEIAAALLISPKTVEANLTRIYRKLGIRRRVDIARRRDIG
jgi:DNA-binding CsgD family transcriptional regulator